jgi:hypothetical protein
MEKMLLEACTEWFRAVMEQLGESAEQLAMWVEAMMWQRSL